MTIFLGEDPFNYHHNTPTTILTKAFQAVFSKIITLFPAKIKEVFLLYQYPAGINTTRQTGKERNSLILQFNKAVKISVFAQYWNWLHWENTGCNERGWFCQICTCQFLVFAPWKLVIESAMGLKMQPFCNNELNPNLSSWILIPNKGIYGDLDNYVTKYLQFAIGCNKSRAGNIQKEVKMSKFAPILTMTLEMQFQTCNQALTQRTARDL